MFVLKPTCTVSALIRTYTKTGPLKGGYQTRQTVSGGFVIG
jgi:hypothetical protein